MLKSDQMSAQIMICSRLLQADGSGQSTRGMRVQSLLECGRGGPCPTLPNFLAVRVALKNLSQSVRTCLSLCRVRVQVPCCVVCVSASRRGFFACACGCSCCSLPSSFLLDRSELNPESLPTFFFLVFRATASTPRLSSRGPRPCP